MMAMNKAEIEGDRPRRKILKTDFRRINLGKLYWCCSISLIQSEKARVAVSRYAKKIVEMIATGSGLLITGERGVGKTGAAAVLIKEAVRRGFTAYFVSHTEIAELRFEDRAFGDGKDGVSVNQKILSAEILFLDGFDEPFLVDKAFGPLQLERLISRRNANGLATVLTTRAARGVKGYSDLHDVIRQTMLPIKILGKNLRDDAENALRTRMMGE